MQKISLNVNLYQFRFKDAPKFFKSTSKSFHLKNVTKGELSGDGVEFMVNRICGMGYNASDEVFTIGLSLRQNTKPIPQVTEKYKTDPIIINNMQYSPEVASHDQRNKQYFTYDQLNKETTVVLMDPVGKVQYSVTFVLTQVNQRDEPLPPQTEMTGERLLVGRYVIYQGRTCYVRSMTNHIKVKICDIFTKEDMVVQLDHVKLIEKSGVNVFELGREPMIIQHCEFDW